MRPSQSASTYAPARVGDATVGAWRVLEHVGLARQCSTYSVIHIDSGATGVLEVYDALPRKLGSYVGRLRAVMQQVNRIEHPGICAILDVGTLDDGRPFVVRAHVEGETLAARIRRRVLSNKQSIAILLAICDVLRAAHACNVVHGALEPEHVILCDGGNGLTIKLLDWGIGDEVRRAAALGALIVRIPPTRAEDVHALGVLMHALFERTPPELEPLWTAMLVDNPSARPSLAHVESELRAMEPAALEAPLMQQRHEPSTSTSVSERVTATAVATPAPDVVTPAPTIDELPPPGRRDRGRAWLVSLGVGAAALAACALYLVRPGPSSAAASTSLVHPRAVSTQPRSRGLAPATPAVATADATASPSIEATTSLAAAAVLPPITAVDAPHPPVAVESAAGQVRPSVAHRPPPAVPPPVAILVSDADRTAEVLALHERVSRRLFELERHFGPAPCLEVAKRFLWIKLDKALATSTSRRLLSMTLTDLDHRLDAARAKACTKVPEAAPCVAVRQTN